MSVSVIVPVFNSEKYLQKCIESLLNQSLSELEIIIIDDASSDGSKEILKKYLTDKRIKVVSKPVNEGVSAARNDGINIATREYIGFVDSDDYVAKDMFEKMYQSAIDQRADVVSAGHVNWDEENNSMISHPSPLPANNNIDSAQMRRYLSQSNKTRFLWYAWRNIYKRDMLNTNNILFEKDIKIGEDSIFNLKAFYYAKRTYVMNEQFYYYRDTPNSLTSKKGKIYLTESLKLQYLRKVQLFEEFGLGDEALMDLSKNVVSHQLPMLLSNEIALSGNGATKIKEILSLEMVANSLKRVSILDKDFSRGVKLIIFLSRSRQYRVLEKLLEIKKALHL